MANNLLYLVDTESGDRICLAKSFGHGWKVFHEPEKIDDWLECRDFDAAFGDASGKSRLTLVCENEEDPSSTLP